jgi:hypothetical protein
MSAAVEIFEYMASAGVFVACIYIVALIFALFGRRDDINAQEKSDTEDD